MILAFISVLSLSMRKMGIKVKVKMIRLFMSLAVFVSFSISAQALTIKKGEVLSGGKVVAAHETETAKRMIEKHGYFISGKTLVVAAGDNTIVLDMDDLIGKSQDQITQILGEEISKNYSDASEITTAAAQEAVSASRDAIGSEVADKITRDVANEVAAEVAASIGSDVAAAVSAEVAAEVAARVEERVKAYEQNGQTELDCRRDSDGNCM